MANSCFGSVIVVSRPPWLDERSLRSRRCILPLFAPQRHTLFAPPNFGIAAAAGPTGIRNVVLVHGAFPDGSGSEAVFNILTKDGYLVVVVQQPEDFVC